MLIKVAEKQDMQAVFALRVEVFVKEQKVPPELELDELDAHALHIIATQGGDAVGCARVIFEGKSAHIGRLAVKKELRGKGVGAAVCRFAVDACLRRGYTHIWLNSQLHALGFYQKLGFVLVGETFFEAGIEHIRMEMTAPLPFAFEYLEKTDFDKYTHILFSMLHNNMCTITPFDESYEDGLAAWVKTYGGAFKNRAERRIVMIYDGDEPIGFFGYCADGDTFLMEEIQLKEQYHGRGILRPLYLRVLFELPPEIKFVEAYAHKSNARSLGILDRFGLAVVGENQGGDCYRLRGELANLIDWVKNSPA